MNLNRAALRPVKHISARRYLQVSYNVNRVLPVRGLRHTPDNPPRRHLSCLRCQGPGLFKGSGSIAQAFDNLLHCQGHRACSGPQGENRGVGCRV